jgi:hypothetical protein
MAGNELNGKIANILFEDTTSHNSKDEIFRAFDMCHVRPKPKKPLCSFYQGCGCDIVTILKNDIHTHILSDCEDSRKEQISQKLKKLESEGYISGLLDDDNGWVFEQNGHIKRMIFTAEPIEAIDFSSIYGVSLFLLFEYNPGDTTRKESFWDSIKKQMVLGGYVIGSYTFTNKFTDRQAFLFYRAGDEIHLCGTYGEINGQEKEKLIEHAEKSGFLPAQGLQYKIIEQGSNLYMLLLSESTRFVYKLWHKPICSFELKDVWWGNHICILQKSQSGVIM